MRILLAPMEGLLDCVLRDILTRVGGVDLCVSEFVRVSGSRLPVRTFLHIAPELTQASRTSAGVPVRVQLLGSDPVMMALNAARLAELNPAGIDLNFGCPAKTVNRHHGGAILLRDPERIRTIVAAVRAAIPPSMLLSAKMRLGYEDKSLAIACAQAMQAGGAQELVVHARTKEEGYKPPAHWEWVGRIRDAVDVPVVANGEIWTLDDYRRCREISGVEDVMLGRGMVANPALARIIKEGEGAALVWSDLQPFLRDFWDLVCQRTLPKYQCGRMKQWLHYLRQTWPEAGETFQRLRTVSQPGELEEQLFSPR
ncbi:tRNA-dihydrouridine synthase C [Formivibrio citricus]|uniref:tRNA-dihydrouridine(16) synthase n=1 Tax=Formivibrio citricus TaxID=83765 RepID=A0A1I4XIU4_9NEIS|nr:tRNA-dihydrouridine synthase [Formivibrio citricus]SFN25150.1 tRNA-dihydrouridine synthase C [Formivibrio citricus]